MANKIYNYDTPGEFQYDTDKIEVSGELAKLKEDLTNVYTRYHLNEVTGAAVLDTSGNGRNGTPINNPVSVAGKLNNCLSFNGTTQYINCGDIANFERTDAFSLEFWINTSYTGGWQCPIARMSSDVRGWQSILDTTGKIWFGLYNVGGGVNALVMSTNETNFNNGVWYHVIITYDGSNTPSGIHIYVNGNNKSLITQTNNLTATILNPANCQIGGRSGTVQLFNGKIDESLIYDKELSQTEVTYRWNSGVGRENWYYPTIIPQPHAHYHLNSIDSGDSVKDTSGNNRDGIAINSPSVVTGKLNNCLDFNGTTQYVNLGNIASFGRTDSFSVEFWFKTTAGAGIRDIIGRMENTGNYRGWITSINNGRIKFNLISILASSHLNVEMASGAFNDGVWYHCVVTYNGSSTPEGVHIYIDNVNQPLTIFINNLSSTIQNSINCQIGARDGANNPFPGNLDEVVIYDKELNSTEVTYRYNSGAGREDLGTYPTIEPTDLFDPATVNSWDSFLETLGGENEGSIGYNLYKVDKANKYYWNGSVWVTGGDSDHYNSKAIINTNIGSFDGSPDKIGFIAYLISDGEQKVELDENQITYTTNQAPLVNAGSNKICRDNQSIAPFSDCTFSDPDGTIDYAYYKVDGEVDTWSQIPQGGYGTLLEAVQAWTFQFTNIGTKIVRLQVEDNEGAKSEDNLEVVVSKYIVTFNVKDETGTHVSDFNFIAGNGSAPQLKSSPFTYEYEYKAIPYDAEFNKEDYISASADVASTDHTENIILAKTTYEETSRIYHPIRIEVKNKKSIIKTLIKGDTILFECKVETDITDWKIRANVWDSGSVDIKKATSNSGGSNFQIEVTDTTGGVFIVKIDKGETTDIENQANLEIELETNEGLIYTVYQSILKFTSEKIKWATP